MKEYFGLGYMQSPNTVFENIFQVDSGEMVKIDRKGTIEKKEFYQLTEKPQVLFEEEGNLAKNQFQTVFTKIIEQQLISDLPVGVFLSGGIDSPLVSANAVKKKEDINAFTLAVENSDFDESTKAAEYANFLNINHSLVNIDEEQLVKIVDEHFRSFKEPFGDY